MKSVVLSLIVLCSLMPIVTAEEAPKEAVATLQILLDAVQENDLVKFESVCTDDMKKGMTQAHLTPTFEAFSPLMKIGYKTDYMGVLDKGAIGTYYWKIDFEKAGSPDKLAELSIRDGKVAGFWIR